MSMYADIGWTQHLVAGKKVYLPLECLQYVDIHSAALRRVFRTWVQSIENSEGVLGFIQQYTFPANAKFITRTCCVQYRLYYNMKHLLWWNTNFLN